MADFCGIGTSIPSTDEGNMFSKVELELRKKSDRRGYSDTAANKNWKVELELKNPAEIVRGQDVNLMFTECWQQYSDTDVSTFLRPSNEGKELLAYRGKRASGISNSSDDTGSSSHSDETEFQRADSITSDFFSFSSADHTFDNRSDVESPSPRSRNQFAPALRSPRQAFVQPAKQHRYCWYCYDVYSAMCAAQGKTAPEIHSRGIWRGHCMKDGNGTTTCPHLWFTTCNHCGATADSAHSSDYCPVVKMSKLNIKSE